MSLVLIVDDQPPIRELLITWISRDGCETAQGADAEAALDEMMARPADVVICDAQIPEQGERGLAASLGFQWHRMSMAIRAKKAEQAESIKAWLANGDASE